MSNAPTSANPRTRYDMTGYVLGGDILSHLGQHPWLDNAGNSPIIARLQGGRVETFVLDRTIEKSVEYRITVTVTPDLDHPKWFIPISIPCFGRPNILDQILDGWEAGRGGTMKARGIRFPGLHKMNDHLELKPDRGAWSLCQVTIIDISHEDHNPS